MTKIQKIDKRVVNLPLSRITYAEGGDLGVYVNAVAVDSENMTMVFTIADSAERARTMAEEHGVVMMTLALHPFLRKMEQIQTGRIYPEDVGLSM